MGLCPFGFGKRVLNQNQSPTKPCMLGKKKNGTGFGKTKPFYTGLLGTSPFSWTIVLTVCVQNVFGLVFCARKISVLFFITWACSSEDRACGYGPQCRGFESFLARKKKTFGLWFVGLCLACIKQFLQRIF